MVINKKSYREYRKRIFKVIDYIEENITDDLSLNELAKVSYFSPFHFHKIFKAMTGETLSDFIRRMRLIKSASMLVYNQTMSITEIAMDCGFSSSTNFSREFKRYYKTTPREFRNKNNIDYKNNKNCIENIQGKKYNVYMGEGSLKIDTKIIPPTTVAYERVTGGYIKENMENAWIKLKKWAEDNNVISNHTRWIGIGYDDPEFTPIEKCRYDACISIDGVIPSRMEEMNMLTIKGGLHAVFSYKGMRKNMPELYDWIYNTWFPGSGYEPVERHPYNIIYDMDINVGFTEQDICVPIKKIYGRV